MGGGIKSPVGGVVSHHWEGSVSLLGGSHHPWRGLMLLGGIMSPLGAGVMSPLGEVVSPLGCVCHVTRGVGGSHHPIFLAGGNAVCHLPR